MMIKNNPNPLFLFTIATVLAGCSTFGPNQLKDTHPLYNAAIVDSQNEQFMQNIVRLHYRDPVFFLDVSSVAASLSMSVSGGMDSNFDFLTGGKGLSSSVGGSYTQSPTIVYAPLNGEDFTRSLLTPISVNNVLSLTESGWSDRRVFGLCVERINDLDNASTASGPTPEIAPNRVDQFNRLLDLFDQIKGEDLIIPRIDPKTSETQLEIKPSAEYQDVVFEIKYLLGLDQKLDVFHVNNDFLKHSSDTISIRSRSLMSIFFYLSHNVDTPKSHQEAGLVTVTKNKDGSEFDWNKTKSGKLFHIHQNEKQPDQAFVSIPYRNQWFYLEDNDLESKSSFMLLSQLFRLQAGSAKPVVPSLTIPVK
ncbi:MAG: hypothetical protein RIQ94_774 [Pseudomonadota bacterium]|jgi:hypothetical protein